MKDITFAHDWFQFEHKGKKYIGRYKTYLFSERGIFEPTKGEINHLKESTAEEIIKEYNLNETK